MDVDKENKQCLIEAMMLLEIAFMGGNDDWKSDLLYGGHDEFDMASFAHGLIQFAHSGYKNEDFMKAKVLVSRISARLAIEGAKESSRNANGN